MGGKESVDQYSRDENSTAKDFEKVTASDTDNFRRVARMVRFGTGGTARIINGMGVTVNEPNIIAGEYYPGWVKRIDSAGTTAGDITAFYD